MILESRGESRIENDIDILHVIMEIFRYKYL